LGDHDKVRDHARPTHFPHLFIEHGPRTFFMGTIMISILGIELPLHNIHAGLDFD